MSVNRLVMKWCVLMDRIWRFWNEIRLGLNDTTELVFLESLTDCVEPTCCTPAVSSVFSGSRPVGSGGVGMSLFLAVYST